MTAWEQVQVMLAEYESLKAEMLQRMGHRFQFMSIAGALGAVALFTVKELNVLQVVALAVAAAVAVFVWWRFGCDIVVCAERVAAIEERVNALAGSPLLEWESSVMGHDLFHSLHGARPPRRKSESGTEDHD